MNLQQYSVESKRTFVEIDGDVLDDLHLILGMQTEVAEIADVFKKSIAYNKKIDLINLKEEIGDLMWYIINFCRIYGFNIEDILQTNINKLQSRYPEKFTTEKALNRDLNVEREILEQ